MWCLVGAFLVGALWMSPQAFGQAGGAGGGAATKENLDLPFDALGSSEDDEEAPELVVFYGQQYEGDGFFYCLDRSGTMSEGSKFPTLQKEVIKNLTQFSERVQFAIVFFDANVTKFPASGRPCEATPAMKAAGSAYVTSNKTGHGTCCKEALVTALSFANQSTAKRKVILYLSDGGTTCPGTDGIQYAQQTLSEVKSRNTQQVKINTLYIGPAGDETPPDHSEQFMKKLAAQNNGQETAVSS
jgi:hypothetical protein